MGEDLRTTVGAVSQTAATIREHGWAETSYAVVIVLLVISIGATLIERRRMIGYLMRGNGQPDLRDKGIVQLHDKVDSVLVVQEQHGKRIGALETLAYHQADPAAVRAACEGTGD